MKLSLLAISLAASLQHIARADVIYSRKPIDLWEAGQQHPCMMLDKFVPIPRLIIAVNDFRESFGIFWDLDGWDDYRTWFLARDLPMKLRLGGTWALVEEETK